MSHEERNTLSAIITNLVVVGFFVVWISGLNGEGAFDSADGLMVWARTVLWIIPASIVATIAVTIIVTIIAGIVTGDGDAETTIDERDRAIGMRGMRITMVAVSTGFIVSLIGLATGWPALAVFNGIIASFAAGDLIGNLAKLVMYRRGV